MSRDGTLHMYIYSVFLTIVLVLAIRFLRGKLLKAELIILMETTLFIVDEDAGCDVHRVDKAHFSTYFISSDYKRLPLFLK